MSEEFEREVLRRVPFDRRAFIKKMVVGAAFVAPVIASFIECVSEVNRSV